MAEPFCSPEEMAALTTMFSGNATLAEAFCTKLDTSARLSGIEEGTNTFFLTVNGALVFVMHAGFAMVSKCAPACSRVGRSTPAQRVCLPFTTAAPSLTRCCRHALPSLTRPRWAALPPSLPPTTLQLCAGAIRSKNTMNILLQTVLDAAVSAVCFYLVG